MLCLVACSSDDSDDAETAVAAERPAMSFFVTSQSGPDGGNFGGLEGADAFCQQLADAAGAGSLTWRAFLSTDDVDARRRIGSGPWRNVNGAVVAENLAVLFATGIPIDEEARAAEAWDEDDKRLLLLDETGEPISSDPNAHDILTGSDATGNRVAGQNCSNWTSGAEDVTAVVGHSDSRGPQSAEQRMMLPGGNSALGWVSVHPTAGCSNPQFNTTGGDGRIYCFAED
jgi:hypothetical protein